MFYNTSMKKATKRIKTKKQIAWDKKMVDNTIELYKEAIKGSRGEIKNIAETLKVSTTTVWRTTKRYPELLDHIKQEKKDTMELIESRLFDKAIPKNPSHVPAKAKIELMAMKMILNHSPQGKARGWGVRVENANVNINLDITDKEKDKIDNIWQQALPKKNTKK